jgi:hypothetical protein
MNIRFEYHADTKTDAKRILRNDAELVAYLAEHGLSEDDCYIDRSNEYRHYVEIPAFKEAAEKYCAVKSAYCARYGSN